MDFTEWNDELDGLLSDAVDLQYTDALDYVSQLDLRKTWRNGESPEDVMIHLRCKFLG